MSIENIKKPNRDAVFQSLLSVDGVEYTHLKMKRRIHNLPISNKFLNKVISKIKWESKIVVIYDSCVYIYNSDVDKKPELCFSLFGFTQVEQVIDESNKEVNWVFRIVCHIFEKIKCHYFSASCKKDMMKWMKILKDEMIKATNTFNGVIMDTAETDRDSLERPISETRIFNTIDTNVFKDSLGDAESEDEYSYIDNPNSSATASATVNETLIPIPDKSINRKESKSNSKTDNAMPSLPNPRTPYSTLPRIPSSEIISSTSSETKPPSINNAPSIPSPYFRSAAVSSDTIDHREVRGRPLPVLPQSILQKTCPLPPGSAQPYDNNDKPTTFRKPPHLLSLQNRPSLRVSPMIKIDFGKEARWEGDADEGQLLLTTNAIEGSYMIRKASTDCGDVLLVFNAKQIKKFRILFRNEMYSLEPEGKEFDSIHLLIEYYRNNTLPNKSFKLNKPYTNL